MRSVDPSAYYVPTSPTGQPSFLYTLLRSPSFTIIITNILRPINFSNTHTFQSTKSSPANEYQRGCEQYISCTPKMPSNGIHPKIEVQLPFTLQDVPVLTDQQVPPRFSPGEIVYIGSSSSSDVQPKNCKKLWVWQSKHDEKVASNMSYLLKDGPGKDAKDVGWEIEDRLREWYEPTEEESLIELE